MGSANDGGRGHVVKTFIFTLGVGLAAGVVFLPVAFLLIGPAALSPPFVVSCLFMGCILAGVVFLLVRRALKGQLVRQMTLLQTLGVSADLRNRNIENMQDALADTVERAGALLKEVLITVEQVSPHNRSLAEASRYLSDRARDGLNAARDSRDDIAAMFEKQEEVMEQVQVLNDRSQDEAALSRELSASLEEMAEAMDGSNERFMETTASVDEMASSLREVTARAGEIARSVENTAEDLDAFGESLDKIRGGVSASAETAETVRADAENGLGVVRSSMEEMERIERDSQQAMSAMQRLSRQTGEVVKIIEVIKELVSDTELLAFNAAIIAAQAGEEGKGFAVVADEIRDLADRTTASAQDIHRIVEAIGVDTTEVTRAVETTGERIVRGKELSQSTGEALHKIVESSTEAAGAAGGIVELTGRESERSRSLLKAAGESLRSVRAVARSVQEQQTAIGRIQEGVTQMKAAADQIGRGMEEQVRANREFDRGLAEREGQIDSINEATRFQMATVQKVFAHFETSEERLQKNTERTALLSTEIDELQRLTDRLHELAAGFGAQAGGRPEAGT